MLKDRLKQVRQELNLTQQDISNRLGISRSNLGTYETRDGEPGSAFISLFCREFNVNEHWLRTGEGDMFNETYNDLLGRMIKEQPYLDDEDRNTIEYIMNAFLYMPHDEKRIVLDFINLLMKKAVAKT